MFQENKLRLVSTAKNMPRILEEQLISREKGMPLILEEQVISREKGNPYEGRRPINIKG